MLTFFTNFITIDEEDIAFLFFFALFMVIKHVIVASWAFTNCYV